MKFLLKIFDGGVNELEVHSWFEGDGKYETNKIAIADNVRVIYGDTYRLYQNTPNPFTQETEFSFYLPEKTQGRKIKIFP